uniref:Uncharacterized protein n=1 Tax=Siphoviridae sp. ct4T77 TaxID=2823563 RepID=A0A8S5L918_9CAUD|nr:MAG TPA: hypothetical protein [Siphoviridae sp. ct4T77]
MQGGYCTEIPHARPCALLYYAREVKPCGLVAGGWTHHERHKSKAHALSRRIFFTLKINDLPPNLNKINPNILKFNKLVIPLQCKG